MTPFRVPPGPLSADTARYLEEAVRRLSAIDQLAVSAPLSVRRASNGQPLLSLITSPPAPPPGTGPDPDDADDDRLVSQCLVRGAPGGPVTGVRQVYAQADGTTYCVTVPDCPACDSDTGTSPPPPGDVTVTVVRTGGPPPDVTFTPDVVDSAGTHHTPGASVGTVTVGGLPAGPGYAVLSSIAGGPWGTPSWTFYPTVGSGPSGTGTVGAFTVSGSGGVLVFTVPPA